MRRTAKPRRRKVTSEFRTIPLKGNRVRGNGEDHGRYFRCGNCGFICDTLRDKRGRTMNNVGFTDFVPNTYPTGDTYSVLGGVGRVFVSHELTADSTKSEYFSLVSVISSGCPFCGTQNYDGQQGE